MNKYHQLTHEERNVKPMLLGDRKYPAFDDPN